jgi:hypothetical protein
MSLTKHAYLAYTKRLEARGDGTRRKGLSSGRYEDMTYTQTEAGNNRQIARGGRGEMAEPERQKVLRERPASRKDVKSEGRSGNVYENKGPNDSLSDTKDDISTWLEAILQRNVQILQKPSALFRYLSAAERTPRFKIEKLDPPRQRQYFRHLLALEHDVIIRLNLRPARGEPLRESRRQSRLPGRLRPRARCTALRAWVNGRDQEWAPRVRCWDLNE